MNKQNDDKEYIMFVLVLFIVRLLHTESEKSIIAEVFTKH